MRHSWLVKFLAYFFSQGLLDWYFSIVSELVFGIEECLSDIIGLVRINAQKMCIEAQFFYQKIDTTRRLSFFR